MTYFPATRTAFMPLLLACGAFVLLHGRSLVGPVLFFDDFQILAQSWTWQRTWEGLWAPQNEHAMPLGRLFCFGLEALAGRPWLLPFLTCLVGPSALLLGLGLLYRFVGRELGHPFYALVAVILFAVTSVYNQAVWWFAASFVLFSLDMILLGLLAAQRWRQTGRFIHLVLCTLACLLAPGWFALGILGGPLCCLYLVYRQRKLPGVELAPSSLRCWFAGLFPLAGTALFLGISLPRSAQAILHASHYQGITAVEAFDPWVGLQFTARSLVDNLLLGLVGVCNVELPTWCIAGVLFVVFVLAVWWWQQVSDHRLMLLGLGLIGSSYLLCYSARSLWPYSQMVQPNFSRYHLLPHLGLVLFFCSGLPARAGRWFILDAKGAITDRQRRFLYGLIGVCFVVQLPRGLLCSSPTDWHQFAEVRAQQAVLRRIEEVDARCRNYHISADAARQALGQLDVPFSIDVIDGWEFLVGSDDPRPLPPEEIKQLLSEP